MGIKIHPHKYKIYGWENPRSLENVISIMRGLIDENKIPTKVLHTFNGGLSFEIACYKFGIYIEMKKENLKRVSIYIDGANFYYGLKTINKRYSDIFF